MSERLQKYKWDDILQVANARIQMTDEELYPLASIRRSNKGFFHRETKSGKEILTKNLSRLIPNSFVISKMQVVHGACSYAPDNFDGTFVSASYLQFLPKEPKRIDTKFLHYYSHLGQSYSEFLISSHGVHIEKMTFNIKDWMKREINLPPLGEQKKIVSILTSVDEVIEKTQLQINKLQDLKKGTMNELLTKGIGHTEFKDSELGRIPKSWKVSTLVKNSSPIKTKNEDNNMNVLTISAQMGMVNQKKYFKKYVSSKDVSHYTLLKKGDFAYNKSYSKGHPVGVVRSLEMYDKGVLSPLYLCFSIRSDFINRSFINYYFDSYYFERELNLVVQEGARAHGLLNIPVQDFYSRKILIPPVEEQIKITKTLSKIKNILNLKKQKLHQTQSLKKSLMQDLLTGKVRVTVN